ncbi:hypothetical protein GUJ93_ZPchr0009g197 [Zizania palustris]|uniref:Uncharacterized protein n=1 Tax=Zizania palustris TaxID=103762 RepID=A0A8J5RCA0_ZIZPA|nr:hypothetical protein GUJ93_ZPchr0009g197 [Zizania palustris]
MHRLPPMPLDVTDLFPTSACDIGQTSGSLRVSDLFLMLPISSPSSVSISGFLHHRAHTTTPASSCVVEPASSFPMLVCPHRRLEQLLLDDVSAQASWPSLELPDHR